MAKRTSALAPLVAALVASQSYGGGIAGPLVDDSTAYDASDYRKAAYGLWQPLSDAGDVRPKLDSSLMNGVSRGGARDEMLAAKSDRLAVTTGGSMTDEIQVRTARAADGKTIKVVVALVLPLSRGVVREVLGDYENMPRFVPDILFTRLSNAGPEKKRVEIEATARFLLLEFPIMTTLDVVYPSDGSIIINSVAGNLAIHGVVQVHGDGPYTRVDYEARITPDFWLPQLIGDFLISRQIKRQFRAMVAEMYRRSAKGGNTPK